MKRNIILILLVLCAATITFAATPQLIDYQGYLMESGTAINGTKNITFKLYDAASGGTQLCSSGAQSVTVTKGLFSYSIGSSGCNLSTINWDNPVYLELTVEGTTHNLEPPFIAIATMNPLDDEGTYPLPAAQLDRFMMMLSVGYPPEDAVSRAAKAHVDILKCDGSFQPAVVVPRPSQSTSFSAQTTRTSRSWPSGLARKAYT